MNAFRHALGKQAKSRTTGFKGIITARSENLYGCNRYFLQPAAGKDMKVPDGFWHDEDDIEVIGNGISAPKKDTGGPISRIC